MGRRKTYVTAGFISIDRFVQNRAPIVCLLFDLIGVRPHPGTGASAGSPICPKQAEGSFSHSIFGLRGRQQLTVHAGGVSLIL